ncbi:hypothetical protein Nepgr_023635 [Nepenthes gracilis]|uniref:Bifunctional inhibitor/plant lipid transfer protein/seed storage helical domain-containing protein n=1 Tax=Nepenthes gracilis TaxID=150966 RepID=A0AAD3XY14_NEPGR|nr:hypothetical protein Nepgr_023635 [Nepenthes gracilis]
MEVKRGSIGRAALLMIAVWLCGGGCAPWAEAMTASECKMERRVLINACKPVILMQPPTPFCCQRIRVTPAECICSVITPKLAPLVNVEYAIQVVESCGRQVQRHFKCGSITTP